MKKYIAFIFLTLSIGSCKKAIEKKQETTILKAMTEGQWVITNFTRNNATITPDFSPYQFKYYDNKTVDAINNGTVEKTGSWNGDINTLSIFANFSNAAYPLTLINGSWHIDNNSWTFVVASQNDGTETRTLRLEKR
jgi:hypothetical protein